MEIFGVEIFGEFDVFLRGVKRIVFSIGGGLLLAVFIILAWKVIGKISDAIDHFWP